MPLLVKLAAVVVLPLTVIVMRSWSVPGWPLKFHVTATCCQLPAAKLSAGVLTLRTVPVLSVTTKLSAPLACRVRWNHWLFTVVASSHWAASTPLPDQAPLVLTQKAMVPVPSRFSAGLLRPMPVATASTSPALVLSGMSAARHT